MRALTAYSGKGDTAPLERMPPAVCPRQGVLLDVFGVDVDNAVAFSAMKMRMVCDIGVVSVERGAARQTLNKPLLFKYPKVAIHRAEA